MKPLFVLFAFLAAAGAQASQVKVDTVDAEFLNTTSAYRGDVSISSYSFQVNPDLGRARLDISYTAPYSGGGNDYYDGPGNNQVLVSGLSFDSRTSQVTYQNERGKVTVCAEVKISRGILGRKIKV